MQVLVSGRNIKVGSTLNSYIEKRLREDVSKYFDNAISGEVKINKERYLYSVNIIVNDGTKFTTYPKSDAQANDVYIAFDMALDKLETQLRRYKSRLKNYYGNQENIKDINNDLLINTVSPIPYYSEEKEKLVDENEKITIIEEKITKIERLTVEEAIMKMDLSSLPALVFVNKDSARINVVYHRADGNISWIDPKMS